MLRKEAGKAMYVKCNVFSYMIETAALAEHKLKNVHELRYPYNLMKHLGVIQESDIVSECNCKKDKTLATQNQKKTVVKTTRYGEPVYITLSCKNTQDLFASIEYVLHYLEPDEYQLIKRRYEDVASFKMIAEEYDCRVEDVERRLDAIIKKIKMYSLTKYIKYGVRGIERCIEKENQEKYQNLSKQIFQINAMSNKDTACTNPDIEDEIRSEGIDEINEDKALTPESVIETLKSISFLSYDEREKVFYLKDKSIQDISSIKLKALVYDEDAKVFRRNKEYFKKLYTEYNHIMIPDNVNLEDKLELEVDKTLFKNILSQHKIRTIEDVLFIGLDNIKHLKKVGNTLNMLILQAIYKTGIQPII